MAGSPNTVFLFGTGLTRAIFSEAPLNNCLLQQIISSNSKTPLARYREKYHTEDIEILLTYLDLEIAQNSSEKENLHKDRETIDNDIAKYFERFRFKEDHLKGKNWLETLATQLFKDNDAIITTNYDCFLEGLLDYHKTWHPKNGYIGVDKSLFENPENPKGIKFYKIHGSEHFVISSGLPDKEKRYIDYLFNERIFPFSGKNSQLGAGIVEPYAYIIAPSFVKIPHFQIADMVNKAALATQDAKNMVICGSGLRDEDSFLRLILTGFMNKGLQNKKKLIIVDPNACAILEKIKNFWIGDTEHINFISIPKGIKEGLDDLTKLLEDCKTNG